MGAQEPANPNAGNDATTPPGPVVTTAARVREGSTTPTAEVDAALARIIEGNASVYAFDVVREEKARAEAAELEQLVDLDGLPLAGVPVAVKHNVAVTGETVLDGSAATDPTPATADHPVVRRLREAGAVVVGLTTVPELSLWGMTDGPDGITRNPWNPERTSGGSSGGAAASVAAGLVPVAHGNDGLGSVRIPAACCGVVGIKPGRGVVPAEVGPDSWGGMTENGVLATTVSDAALALSVLAGRPELADVDPPAVPLRVALAVDAPSPLIKVDRHWTAAARTAGSAAATAGHAVETTKLPYGDAVTAVMLRWPMLAIPEADELPHPERLQPRTRRHLALGRLLVRLNMVRPAQVERVEARLVEFFENYDVVITPALALPPPVAKAWHAKGWLTNFINSPRYSPFTPMWNLVGWPAMSVPMGLHPESGTPVAAQLAGPPGSESTLLRLAAQLEALHPWPRTTADRTSEER
ncbi:amidase [Nocardia cyriacigeorgica]|uniref:amidase n=1 Tax=Nocardia cyriacigeorgica TaxID=135487 RepID=UPI00158F37B1|nr:amidase family protein [Nocardia cyriacigeorgica]